MGKPYLIVDHHEYFKDGYCEMASLVDDINSLTGNIQWKGLGEIIRNTYSLKTSDDGSIFCKVYGNDIVIENDSEDAKEYVILKKDSNNVSVKGKY